MLFYSVFAAFARLAPPCKGSMQEILTTCLEHSPAAYDHKTLNTMKEGDACPQKANNIPFPGRKVWSVDP